MTKKFLTLALALLACPLLTLSLKAVKLDKSDEYEPLQDPLAAPVFIEPKTAKVPIIMYHMVTDKPKYTGSWGIFPKELESDLKFLHENGYNTVVMQDLIDFVQQGKPLPERPIVLTFDDGNLSDYTYLFPLLQKYDQQAVLCIMGKQADEYTDLAAQEPQKSMPNLTWAQIKELQAGGHIEIQSHGYDVHGATGIAKKKNQSAEEYRQWLSDDLQKLQDACEANLGTRPTTFAYPLGIISEEAAEVLNALGFDASLSCRDGLNELVENDRSTLWRLCRNNRPSGKSLQNILQKLGV